MPIEQVMLNTGTVDYVINEPENLVYLSQLINVPFSRINSGRESDPEIKLLPNGPTLKRGDVLVRYHSNNELEVLSREMFDSLVVS